MNQKLFLKGGKCTTNCIVDRKMKSSRDKKFSAGGPGGMKIIEQIALEAHHFLQPGGWLFLEIGADQKKAVGDLFRLLAHRYREVRILDDWAGRPRVVQARHVPR